MFENVKKFNLTIVFNLSIAIINLKVVMMQNQKICSIAQSLSSHRHVIACSFRLILNSDFALEIFLFS